MSLIIDKEIDLGKEDLLATKIYADTVKELILKSPKDEPLTIGLFGPWGSGKSSIIRTLQDEIGTSNDSGSSKSNAKKNESVKKPAGTAFVIYDAWKYANDSFRRTFLLTLQQALDVPPPVAMKNFYQSSSEEVKVKFEFNVPFLLLVVFTLLVVGLHLLLDKDWRTGLSLTVVVAFMSYTTVVFSKTFIELKQAVQTPVVSAPELFESCFNELISRALSETVVKKWCSKDEITPASFDKIVIVVDNIDRCSKEAAYELLTNTKNFINAHQRVVFLIPMDDDALKKHLFKSDAVAGEQAEEFLRKYFNVVVRMKEFRNTEIFDFADKINKKYKIGLKKDTVNIIAREYAKNPRRIIQFYNNLSSELSTMKLRCGETFRNEHEAAICKLLIIREQWPDKFKEICNHPKALLDYNFKKNKPNENEKKTPQSPDSYENFLESTFVSTRNLKQNDLLKILMNADNYESFPESLREVIQESSWEKIEIALKNEGYTQDKLLNYLHFKLKPAIDNELFDTDVSDILDLLMTYLLVAPEIDKNDIERVETTTLQQLDKILPSVKSFERLVQFNQLARKNNQTFVDDHIKLHFKGFAPQPEDDFEDSDYLLYQTYINVADRAQTLNAAGFFARFLQNRPSNERVYKDLKPSQFSVLYNNSTVQEVFFNSQVAVWLDNNYEHWISLLKLPGEGKAIVKKLLDNAASSLELKRTGTEEYIVKFRPLLQLFSLKSVDIQSVEKLEAINRFIFTSGSQESPFTQRISSERRPELFKYLLESFRITMASEASAKWIFEFFNTELIPPYARSLGQFIHTNRNKLNPTSLKPLINRVQYIDDDIQYLHMQTLYLKINDQPLFSDSEISEVLVRLINEFNEYPEYSKHLKAHLATSRGKLIMKDIVSNMQQEELNLMPESLKKLIDKL